MVVNGKKNLVTITEKNVVSLDPANGKVLWQTVATPAQRFYNSVSPYIDGNKIYISGLGTGTKALEISENGGQYTVKELWNNAEAGAKWNTAVLKNGYLYGFSDLRRIYAINASTGATAWIDNATNSDFATLVDCGSVLIGMPSTGNLIVFKADPASYSEVARYKVSETPVYTFPIVSGSNIYIKNAESLILYGLTK
jgi:outer membrane protein assembly factor BamB